MRDRYVSIEELEAVAEKCNTSEQLLGVAQRIAKGGEDELQSLKASWNKISLNDEVDEEPSPKIKPLDSFLTSVWLGVYPSPEVLVSIAECFDHYYNANGKLSLEQVFFRRPVQNMGNESARASKHKDYRNFHFYLAIEAERKRGEGKVEHLKERASYLEKLFADIQSRADSDNHAIDLKLDVLSAIEFAELTLRNLEADSEDVESQKRDTQQDQADRFIEKEGLKQDRDSFLKGYRNWLRSSND